MTSIASGEQRPKSDMRIEAIGAVDELNAVIGILVASLKSAENSNDELVTSCQKIQHWLFDVGGELAMPKKLFLPENATSFLEKQFQLVNQQLPPLKEFVIPGENVLSAITHLARSVARRAERCIVALQQLETNVPKNTLVFINRLSDYLFVLSRQLARADNKHELQWRGSHKQEKNK